MGNIITELKAAARQEGRQQGLQEGRQEGLQEGRFEMLRDTLRKRIEAGVLTVDAARAEVALLGYGQVITTDEARRLLAELG